MISNNEYSDLISVIIPLYNHAPYIVQALESAVVQGPIVKDIIVIDDGSKDASLSIARDFAVKYPHVETISQQNRGTAMTLNRGVQAATADYVAILNSDDFWFPNRLNRLIRAMELDEGLDLAASGIAFVDDSAAAMRNRWYEEALDNFIACRDLGLALMDANFLMTTSNFVVRRRVFDELGGFANLRYAHDMDFALRLALDGRRIGFVDDELLAYRFHGANTIKENHANVRADWAMVASFFLWGLTRKAAKDIERIQRGWQILDRHGLRRAAQECIDYFDANPAASLAVSSLVANESMKSRLLAAV